MAHDNIRAAFRTGKAGQKLWPVYQAKENHGAGAAPHFGTPRPRRQLSPNPPAIGNGGHSGLGCFTLQILLQAPS